MANGTLFTQFTPYTRTCSLPISFGRFKGRRCPLPIPARLPPSELGSARSVSASPSPVARASKKNTTSDVRDILERIRGALTLSFPSQAEVVIEGHGWHLGTDVMWRLRCRPDGAFLEEIKGKEMRWTWGYDGGRYSKCWEVDGTGVAKQLELDDNESLLLSVWVRSGFWLNPNMVEALAPRIVIHSQDSDSLLADAVVNTTALQERCGTQLHVPPGGPSTSSPPLPTLLPSYPAETTLALQLPNGQVVSMLTVSTETWRPISMKQRHFSDLQTWHFRDWQSWDASVHFPSETHHLGSGGANRFCTVTVKPARVASMASYSMPPSPLRPADTRYNSMKGSRVPAWWTASGHLVVRPLVSGRFVGYMILDTGASSCVLEKAVGGASGCVLEKAAAEKLRLPAFGQLHIATMAGKVKSQFRRAASLRLGPLLMKDPVFMEMSLSNLVRGAPGPVTGIIGYDLFRRAVVTIPPAGKAGEEVTILVEDPESFAEAVEVADHWQNARMIANLPHVEANFLSGGHRKTRPAMFMVDSGAGGVDVMFHDRAVTRHGLTLKGKVTTQCLKGAGGAETAGMDVRRGNLRALELKNTRFENLSCLFTGPGGLEMSVYTSGIICANLMARCTVIVDYARGRMAFLPVAEESMDVE